MKQSALFWAASAVLLALLASCGKQPAEEPDQSAESEEIVADIPYEYSWQEYIVPGSYTFIEVPGNQNEVPEALIDRRIQERVEQETDQVPVEGRHLQQGDTVYFDQKAYIGSDGSQADWEERILLLGSDEESKEFEAQMTQLSVGDSKEFSVQYATDFPNELYAGQTVHYFVTITAATTPSAYELTDELVRTISSYATTVEEYRAEVRQELLDEYQSIMETMRENAIWNAVLEDTAIIKMPEDSIRAEMDAMWATYTEQAENEGMTLDEYKQIMKENGEDLEETVQTQSERKVIQRLAQQAIMDLEGLTLSEEDYQAYGEQQCLYQGYETLEAWEQAVGKDAVKEEVTYLYVTDVLLGYAEEVQKNNDISTVLGYSEAE